MHHLRRLKPPLRAAILLAVLGLLGVLAWNVYQSLPLAHADRLPPRPLRADITVVPHLGKDYVSVTADYILLEDWPEDRVGVGVLAPEFFRLEVHDRVGSLEPTLGDWQYTERGSFQWLHVPLRSTATGYTFSLSYAFDAYSPLRTVGDLEYPALDGNRQTRLTFALASEGVEVWRQRTSPRPQAIRQVDGYLYVTFDLGSSDTGVMLVYRPAGGLDRLRIRTEQVTVAAGGNDYRFAIHYPTGAEEAAQDVAYFVREMLPVLAQEVGAGPPALNYDVFLRYQVPYHPWAIASYSAGYPQQIDVYLQNLTRRPSLVIAHELMHDYIAGGLPLYLEEGLAELVADGWVTWRHGFVEGHEPEITADHPIGTSELMAVDYGAHVEEVFAGYEQGEHLAYRLAVELGDDAIRDMVTILRDEDADLQTVVCAGERGQELYDLLADLDLVIDPDLPEALAAEGSDKLRLYDRASCTLQDGYFNPPTPVALPSRTASTGDYVKVLGLVVLLCLPRLGGLVVLGGLVAGWAGARQILGGYPLDFLVDQAWLPVTLGLLLGAVLPELAARLLLAGPVPEPTFRCYEELRNWQRRTRRWHVRLRFFYGLSMLPVLAAAVYVVLLPGWLPYQASFMGGQAALFFAGTYGIWAVVTWQYVMRHVYDGFAQSRFAR